jgi:hypothetical protein
MAPVALQADNQKRAELPSPNRKPTFPRNTPIATISARANLRDLHRPGASFFDYATLASDFRDTPDSVDQVRQ